MKAACNRATLEKLKCFGKIPIEWKLMLLLPYLWFTLSCALSLSFSPCFCLSPSEWPVYLSWILGSAWALLGSNWRLCWYERFSESVWEKGGRKETRLQWRSHLRPQLMRNRSGGSGWEKARPGVFVQCSSLHRLICFGPVLITRSLVFMCFCYICWAFDSVRTSLGQLYKHSSR